MKHKKLVFRYLIPYLVVLVIPFVTLWGAYAENVQMLKDSLYMNAFSALQQFMAVSDKLESEIEFVSSNIANNYDAIAYTQNDSPLENRTEITQANETHSSIFGSYFESNLKENIFVYFTGPNVLMTPTNVYLGFEENADLLFQTLDYTVPELKTMLSENIYFNKCIYLDSLYVGNASGSDLSLAQEPGVLYIRSFQVANGAVAQVVVYLTLSEITQSVQPVLNDFSAELLVLDKSRHVYAWSENLPLAANESDVEAIADAESFTSVSAGADSYYLVKKQSLESGLSYHMLIPQNYINTQIVQMKRILWMYSVATILIAIVAALYFAIGMTRKFMKLLNATDWQVQEGAWLGKSAAYNDLANNIANMYQEKAALQEKIERSKPLMKNSFVEKLVHGSFSTRKEMETLIQEFGFEEYPQKELFVLSMRVRLDPTMTYDETISHQLNMIKAASEECLSQIMRYRGFYYDSGLQDRVYILTQADVNAVEQKTKLNHLMNALSVQISEEFGMLALFALGTTVENLPQVHNSYEEAEKAMQVLRTGKENSILWFEDISTSDFCYYYPTATENYLLGLIQKNKTRAIHSVFQNIYEQNFVKHTLDREMCEIIVANMKGTVLKAIGDLPEKNRKAYINQTLQLDAKLGITNFFIELETLCHKIAEEIQDSQQLPQNQVIVEIQKYLAENFQNEELNLNVVAYEYKLHASYLSRLFKENTGVCFFSYLENLRLTKACDLISDGLLIQDVAKQTGYSNVYVFRTAFKRKYGVSPSSYKQDSYSGT